MRPVLKSDKVEIILGPPGTGKTTTLLKLVDEHLLAGGDPMKVAFISFTRKSVDEARARAMAKFDLPKKSFHLFRTIHSLAYYMQGMSQAMVLQKSHYKELGELLGMQMTGVQRQEQEIYEMLEGDQYLFIESLSRLKCETLYDTWRSLNSDVEFERLEYFARAIKQFKLSKLIWDFTDMLQHYLESGQPPKMELLIVDEAQDLSRLQWRIVEKLVGGADRAYIAGDDDQAIFRWSGADIEYFMHLPRQNRKQILGHSYRLPMAIHSFSRALLGRMMERNDKSFTCTDEPGQVMFIDSIEHIDMSKGSWLILHRNGWPLKEVESDVRRMGYPYQTQSYSTDRDESVVAAALWERLRRKESISAAEAKIVLEQMSRHHAPKHKITRAGQYTLAELVSSGHIRTEVCTHIWHEALDLIEQENIEYYLAVRLRNEPLLKTPRIKISTIHGAKGGEADNVVLFCDMSLKTFNAMESHPDDEVRVFYVGTTRARKNLYLVNPQTRFSFSF